MTLRAKIVAILSVVLAGYGVAGYLVQRNTVYPRFVEFERDAAYRDMERCVKAVRNEVSHLSLMCADWARWDDTYGFVETKNAEYIELNLGDESFEALDLEVLAFYDARGARAYVRCFDRHSGSPFELKLFATESLPQDHPLTRHTDLESAVGGVLNTERGPMLVSSRPIIHSDGSGPANGTLVMGRFLDAPRIEAIRERTSVDVRIWAANDPELPASARQAVEELDSEEPPVIQPVDADLLRAYGIYPDMHGQVGLVVRADIPRTISMRGREAANLSILSLAGAGVVIAVVLYWALQQIISGPIANVTAHTQRIGREDDLHSRINLARRDEIGQLARAFDDMVGKLAQARAKLTQSSYDLGRADMTAGVLHTVRNALTPILAKVDTLRGDLGGLPLREVSTAREEIAQGSASPARERDLQAFVAAAETEIAAAVERAGRCLDDVARLTSEVERILAAQARDDRSERVLETFSVETILDGATALLDPRVGAVVRIEREGGMADLPPVRGERLTLVQVLVNVLLNAAESVARAERERGLVTVHASLAEETHGVMLHLRVTDNGAGIPAEHLPRLMERGFTTKERAGSGLGLHWCANALRAMGGRISAESKGPGHGATFHVSAPVVPSARRPVASGHAAGEA